MMARFSIWMLVMALMALCLFNLVSIYTNFRESALLAGLAFLLLAPGVLWTAGLREYLLGVLAILLAVGLFQRLDGMTDVVAALERAAFFAAFIYLVTLLKEAAERSPSVLALGEYLTRQPAGRRYWSLATGGHAMGVVLNFGAISLITPLIQRGIAAEASAHNRALLERQQISALLRGFAWMIMWSPTALTQAVLFASFPGANPLLVVTLGISATIVMVLLGWAEAKGRQDVPSMESGTIAPMALPVRAALRFTLVCASLMVGAFIITRMAGVSAAQALMFVAPLIMVIWILSHRLNEYSVRPLRAAGKDLATIVFGSAPVLGKSAYILGMAGFIGEAAARLAPVDALAAQMQQIQFSDWAFLMCLPVMITLGGQIALSPILVVVFLSSVINQLPVLPANPSLIVFALGAGWALSMAASPNASATLLISGITGISPTTLTWRWNGQYALMCAALFFLMFYVLTQLFSH